MSTGAEIILGLKKAATWGTPVECGAADAAMVLTSSFAVKPEMDKDDSAGQVFPGAIDTGLINCDGDLSAYMRYDDMRLLAAIMGAAAAPAQQGATTAYQHVLSWATDINGIFYTLAQHLGYSVHEFPSVKFGSLEITGKVGASLEMKVKGLAINRNINTTTGTNNTTTIAALNPSSTPRVRMAQGAIRMNAQGGIALASGDRLVGKNCPTSFTLSINRNQKGEHLADGTDMICEPEQDGFPAITLKIDLPEYVSDSYLQKLQSGDELKADFTFTGSLIADTYYRSLLLELPRLRVTSVDGPAISKGAKLKQSVTFELLRPDTAPAGMTGLTLPLRATIINTQSTSLL
jgi:hypothetical protein